MGNVRASICGDGDSSVGHIWVRNITLLCTKQFLSFSPKNITYVLKNGYFGMNKHYHSYFTHRNEKKLFVPPQIICIHLCISAQIPYPFSHVIFLLDKNGIFLPNEERYLSN